MDRTIHVVFVPGDYPLCYAYESADDLHVKTEELKKEGTEFSAFAGVYVHPPKAEAAT